MQKLITGENKKNKCLECLITSHSLPKDQEPFCKRELKDSKLDIEEDLINSMCWTSQDRCTQELNSLVSQQSRKEQEQAHKPPP